ncbi:MAG: hypothetical protein GY775_12475 [Candidatus Scalindua sp.]|nr:hypothetical protein [Candidatus Scalindua sp.]
MKEQISNNIDCCSQKNPLVRNGTSQSERLIQALLPSYIKIDEKTIEDTVSFAHKYAKLIKYYDKDNQSRDNWQEFFQISSTVLLAIISVVPYKTVEENVNTLFKKHSDSPTPGNARDITNMVYRMASEIQNWNKKISSAHKLKSFIQSEIINKLQNPLTTLAQIDKSTTPINDYNSFYNEDWDFKEEDFDNLDPIDINDGDNLITMVGKDLASVYKIFFQSYVKIILNAKDLFQSDIIEEDDHKPHITLFISFLYLFQYAKDYLNNLTSQHLDFYYKDVLRLEKNGQIPDKVHVIFELAENYTSHALEKGTALKAGKDPDGKALSYELTEEIVANKATVDQLKTVYLNPDDDYKIYAATNANSADGAGGEFSDESDCNWKPFGGVNNTQALVGVAIASPVLLLKEGERTITITLNLDEAVTITSLKENFNIQLSAEENWFDVELSDSPEVTSEKLQFVVKLSSGDPAIVPFNNEILDGGFDTSWPMVKIYLNKDSETYAYGHLKDRIIETIDIDVACQGIRDLIIQNDQTLFSPDNASQPFGPRPSIGSNFYIGSEEVLGKELDTLSLVIEWLDLPPSRSFSDHYSVYNTVLAENINNESFKAKISYLENKIWNPLFGDEDQNLFDLPPDEFVFIYFPLYFVAEGVSTYTKNAKTVDAVSQTGTKASRKISEAAKRAKTEDDLLFSVRAESAETEDDLSSSVGDEGAKDSGNGNNEIADTESLNDQNISVINLTINKDGTESGINNLTRYNGILDLDTYNSTTQRGFLRLQLSGKDFQHTKYSEVYTKQALKLSSVSLTNAEKDAIEFPNEPYTPTIKSLYLDYTSSVQINLTEGSSKTDYDSRIEQLFYIYPFGQNEIHPYLVGEDIWAVPQFTIDKITCTGHLYIGLKDALPSQAISILFQVYDGSGDPEKEVPPINWLYLKGNQWYPFADADILFDSTNGLVKSGIIKFLLPSDIANDNTLLDKSCLWIKGSIEESVQGNKSIDAFPDLIDVKAQAAIASFKDNENVTTHLESAMPAGTISKLTQRVPAIKSVSQPYASFGSRTQESDDDFYRRISERLRHKNRAIAIWDYERLVLQEFPSIHRVKCLNHTNRESEIAPGCVMVVVIPDLRNKNAVNMLEPKVDVGTIEDIRSFLAERNTLFVKGSDTDISDLASEKLKVVNPIYERVKVSVKVKIKKDDDAYYQKVLNNDLKNFLAPWAFDEGAEIGFGSTLHKSAILNFIENREYIDFLTDLKLEHFIEGPSQDSGNVSLGSKDEIQTTSAWSILTSYGIVNEETGIEHGITTDAGCSNN